MSAAGILMVALALAAPAGAEQLNVALAANFFGTLQKLAPEFQQASGIELLPSSGASGQFYTQIREGAPFDLLLSADADRPKQLEKDGLAIPGSRFTYAVGTLVLWSPKAGVVDHDGKVLSGRGYRMIGIAEPRNAPYGAAAQQVLASLGLWDSLNRKHQSGVAVRRQRQCRHGVCGALPGQQRRRDRGILLASSAIAVRAAGSGRGDPDAHRQACGRRGVHELATQRSAGHRHHQGGRLPCQGMSSGFYSADDLAGLWISLKLASITAIALLLVCTPLAWWLAMTRSRLRVVGEALAA